MLGKSLKNAGKKPDRRFWATSNKAGDFILDDKTINELQEYIERNFDCQPCLVNNILKHVASLNLSHDETLDLLETLLDGLGIEKYELDSII